MIAQHPVTGKQIKIIPTRTQLWRDTKTVVFLDRNADPSVSWTRWETLAFGLETIKALQEKNIEVHIPVLLNEPSITAATLKDLSVTSHLLVVSQEILKQIPRADYESLQIGNILCLEEFAALFSYLGAPWNGSQEDAACLITAVLRFSRIAGISTESTAIQSRLPRLAELGISLLGPDAQPEKLWLIQQFFKPSKAKREREIKKCLEQNIACPYIDTIVLLNEEDFSSTLPSDPKKKIVQEICGKRLTYRMVLDYIYTKVPPNVFVCFSNSDIYLESSIQHIWTFSLQDRFISLLRWDVPDDSSKPPVLFGPRADSQDTWILSSNSVKSRVWKWDSLDFPFGKNGCDNAINVEMLRQKFLISNPAYSIKTLHLHTSGVRTYNPLDIVDKNIYLHIEPTGLNDMNARESWPIERIAQKVPHVPFSRVVKSVQTKEIDTFCSMIKRSNTYTYVRGSMNTFQTQPDIVLRLEDSYLTMNGLPFGHHEMYIGPSQTSQELWAKESLGGCVPTLSSDTVVGATLTNEILSSRENFCLHYISKILQLMAWDEFKQAEFLCPKDDLFVKTLGLFKWSRKEIPVLPRESHLNIHFKKGIVLAASDTTLVTKEDVDALRRLCVLPWQEKVDSSSKPRLVVLQDGTFLDSKWIGELEELLEEKGLDWDVRVVYPTTSLERVMDGLCMASYFVYANTATLKQFWPFLWICPGTCQLVEIQNEMDPQGDGLHLAGACDLHHSLVIARKGIREPTMKDCLKQVSMTLFTGLSTNSIVDSLPTVWIPRADIEGFFAHPGDSFREMARLWSKRGYCATKEHPVASLCWWGDVGSGVLLYDRPTMDWMWTAPPIEQAWKKGLFGNPEPPTQKDRLAKAWSFWPRRPEFVEAAVEKKFHTHSWTQRTKTLVFYGKIENKVQERRRTTSDWMNVCDEFVMPRGPTTSYLYTQEEYIQKLSEAKFGLCLAGYGKKCHREVECMAMGTVPICDKEVDISSYAEPPVEGTHYLRVQSPDEIPKLLESMTEEKWTAMSAACHLWWKQNSSCEGMFALTKRLVESFTVG